MADFPPFAVSLRGVEHSVRYGLAQTIACLAPLQLTSDDIGTVELVLAEALNNVVEHALVGTAEQTTIEIHGYQSAAGLCLTIIDRGLPMPSEFVPNAIAPDLNVPKSKMPEGGFGWYMIHTLATEVRYSRVGTANHLTLQLSVGA